MGLLKSITMKTSLGKSDSKGIEVKVTHPTVKKKSIINFSPANKIIMAKKSMMPPAHVWNKIEKILDQQNANKKKGKDSNVTTQLNLVKGEKQYSI